jgi:hypothetical protein
MKKPTKKKKKNVSKKTKPTHMFSSSHEYIDYAFGEDPILCQALKNCIEE